MNALLVSALCATALNVQSLEVKKDTIDKYFIDRKEITDFNGRQLEGKTISMYFFAYQKEGDVVNRLHIIKTEEKNISINPKASSVQSPKTEMLTVVDGKEMSAEKLSEIKAEEIVSIDVHKPGSKVAESYGKKGAKGVMVIVTKAAKKEDILIYIVDGKRVSAEVANKISSEGVASMKIDKRSGSSVIEITTK